MGFFEKKYLEHKITGIDVEDKIKQAIQGNLDISNAHGVDLHRCFVRSVKEKYLSIDQAQAFELWTVLEF